MVGVSDLLCHEPRLAILHPPDFTDTRLILSVVDQPRWYDADPEFVVVAPDLNQLPIIKYFEETFRHSAVFVAGADDPTWINTQREVIEYATHLLVFLPQNNVLLRQLLKDPKRPQRPMKVVIV